MTYEQHVRICRRGDTAKLRSLIDRESDLIEKEVLWITTFHIMDDEGTDEDILLRWGEDYVQYVREHRRTCEPFDRPDWKILKRMAIINEQRGDLRAAIAACDATVEFGIADDGTKAGFPGRRSRLMKELPNQSE